MIYGAAVLAWHRCADAIVENEIVEGVGQVGAIIFLTEIIFFFFSYETPLEAKDKLLKVGIRLFLYFRLHLY